jgi:5-methylcytosine-specific restriction endonuclease McrA
MADEMRVCPKCNIEKPFTVEFWKPIKALKSGLMQSLCRECFNAYYREKSKNDPEWRREKERLYKERNPDKYAAKLKRHHQRAVELGKNKYCNRNIEKCRQRDRERWRTDPEYRQKDRERWERRKANGYNEHERERYKENPLPKMLKANKRRVLKLNAKGTHTEQQLRWKYEYYGKRCYYCNKPLSINELTEDHRIPLSKGGTDWIANIVPCCRRCNPQKGNKTEQEYRNWLLSNIQENIGGGLSGG